jgi:hypothetical protein
VRKGAARADLDSPAVLLPEYGCSRAVLKMIKRTIAEEAVDLFDALVAWIVFAFPVREKSA